MTVRRSEWRRACAIARNGGALRPTLANLVAAYRIVRERNRASDDFVFAITRDW